MPKVSQAHLDARRAEILEGARRAFARYGYDGATVARLEEEIGLSRGAIFHYFDGKLDLFASLANADNARYQNVLAEQGLDALVGAIADADRNWLKVLIETEVKLLNDPEFRERVTSTPQERQAVLDVFAKGQANGELRSDIGAADLARFTAIVINGLALAISADTPIDVDSVRTLVNDAVRPRD